ncbi:EAL domain-containing protein [Antarcticirhabdus aurantiaca]|uniref:EAL domain-containing protein n=1 Tax=Antarcticirhabdus aurantiaca TaxID=2606717 RepID=A0ACD4NKL7_9HYPH|nr:EAL domain-containing protein [Antarcticirhabdus aurantiaca]WAJ27289.1 EAL domain-containing protein [Jeongeuplla avenae]
MSFIVALAASHSVGFVLLAACVCTLMAILVVTFGEHARGMRGRRRIGWLAAIAVIAGFGVWTTHFVAIIGYRPDIVWSFDLRLTLASALLSILLAGGPLALAAIMRRRAASMACGATAGLGIGAMHFTGMAALEGCVASHSAPTIALSLSFGMVFAALAFAMRPVGLRLPVAAGMLVLAVCFLHFTAVAGVDLQFLRSARDGGDSLPSHVMAVAVAAVAMMIIVVALLTAVHQSRLDASDARQARALAEQADLLSNALHNMSNGLVMLGADERVVLHNQRAVELLNLAPGEIAPGLHLTVFLGNVAARHGWSADKTMRAIANHRRWMAQTGSIRVEETFESGSVVSVSCRPLNGGAILTFDDVTREHQTQSRMAHMAHHDELTGLPNRRAFRGRLEAAVAAGRDIALLVIDLDRFKEINDTLGHAAGDKVLVRTADRLRAACGPGDFLARLGGDELAVIHEREGNSRANAAAELAARLIHAVAPSDGTDEAGLHVGCSVGMAETADMAGVSTEMNGAELIMRQADLALYRAKESGRGRVQRFEQSMMEAAARRRRLETDMARALAENELSLAFQPLFDIEAMRVASFEALVRWKHPERGWISPAEFIPEAERTGQILAIGEFVLREACRRAADWPTEIGVAINVSPVQIRTPGFPLLVASALSANRLMPSRLEIELTETAMVEDGTMIATSLSALRALGVGVSMDDFGTGYSSLAHLRNFELDRIKIDRSFVDAAPSDPGCLAVLRAVTQLGRELGVKTLGEGVETPEQLAILRDLGCDGAQGFLLGRPLPAEEVADFIALSGWTVGGSKQPGAHVAKRGRIA